MKYADSHTHLYLPEFDNDREEVMARALKAGVEKMFLPNIDEDSVEPMMKLVRQYPGVCYPMMGLHPGSVDRQFRKKLDQLKKHLDSNEYTAIGEIGMDLYWDTSYREEQKEAFSEQMRWAAEHSLPVVIHIRNAFPEVFDLLEGTPPHPAGGIFHCFSGNTEQARRAIEMGFHLGIGGVLTFARSGLQEVVREIPLRHLVLETDSPYLAPVPYRGKRNETAYLPLVAEKIAEIKGLPAEEVTETCYANTLDLFLRTFPEQ